MDSIINLQKKIVPELTDLLVQRYQILRQVSHESPIGRRALAGKLGLSERVLRAQVDFLKKSGLLAFSASGMSVTDEGADILKEDVGVRSVVDIIKKADILVHGVGRASVMARHRRLAPELIAKLEEAGAVGEAFGQYCALDGTQVYMTNNAGLMLQDLQHIGTIIGIAGGKSKAAAILSVIRASRQDILVTDEAAATEILRMDKENS